LIFLFSRSAAIESHEMGADLHLIPFGDEKLLHLASQFE